jgi:hypothetical protein
MNEELKKYVTWKIHKITGKLCEYKKKDLEWIKTGGRRHTKYIFAQGQLHAYKIVLNRLEDD